MGRKNTRKMKSDDDDESYDPRDEPKRTYNRLKEAVNFILFRKKQRFIKLLMMD